MSNVGLLRQDSGNVKEIRELLGNIAGGGGILKCNGCQFFGETLWIKGVGSLFFAHPSIWHTLNNGSM
jgi:hypothetical protein